MLIFVIISNNKFEFLKILTKYYDKSYIETELNSLRSQLE
jgi:hypothetical protein